MSLSSLYYLNNSYAEDIIGYTAGLSFKIEKSINNTDNLYRKFLTKIDYIKTNTHKSEKEMRLLWQTKFLYIDYLILKNRIRLLNKLREEIEELIELKKDKLKNGYGYPEDITTDANQIYKIMLEQEILSEQTKNIKKILSIILDIKDIEINEEPIYINIPFDNINQSRHSNITKLIEDFNKLSKKRYYPRMKFSLGFDKTWNDSSGSMWTGFSFTLPLNFYQIEKSKNEELYYLWEKIKKEEELKNYLIKEEIHKFLDQLWNIQIKKQIVEQNFERKIINKNRRNKIDAANTYISGLLFLDEYYKTQTQIYTLLSSLGAILQTKELPGKEKMIIGMPPREITVWFWDTQNTYPLIKILNNWDIKRIYFSLNNEQIEEIRKDEYWLKNIVLQLNKKGIKTEILLGEPTWIFPENRQKLIDIIKLIEEKIFPYTTEIHLDIEPWSLEDFEKDKDDLLKLYLDTLQEIKEKTYLKLIIDTPVFFFKEKLNYKGKEELIIEHVIDMIDGLVVMNYLSNKNSFLNNAKKIAFYLNKKEIPYWIGLSIERNVDQHISFSHLERSEFQKLINEALIKISPSHWFRGLAIQNLKELATYDSYSQPSQTKAFRNSGKCKTRAIQ